jgi:outer membrane protein, heavy metal efflux system
MRIRTMVLVAISGLALLGCATVDPQPQWQKVETIAKERTEGRVLWQRTEADAETIRNQVNGLLAKGLSRQDAVRVALMNNKRLQASFERVGIAQSDLVQAGLLSNPTLDVFLAFPLSNTDTTGGLLGFLSDLWTIPARKKVAAARAEVEVQQVGVMVIATASEAAMAYDDVLFRQAALDLEHEFLKVQSDTAARMKIRCGHGLANNFELDHARAMVLEQKVRADAAEKELINARTRLNTALSLTSDQAQYRLNDKLDKPPENKWNTDSAVSFALKNRLDLQRERIMVEQAEHEVEYERTRIFRSVGVGPAWEGSLTEGSDNSIGPIFSLELPVFDQNQAQIAKAEYRLRQMQKGLETAEMQARKEVTDTVAEIDFRRKEIEILRNELKSTLEREVEYAEKWGSRMQLNFLNLLAAREQELIRRRTYIESLRGIRNADVRLHQALWGGGAM